MKVRAILQNDTHLNGCKSCVVATEQPHLAPDPLRVDFDMSFIL
jgi:hypothetical protein